ncbi:Uncharacterised protein [Mycobacteroides abscessus subsp. abscessus]|nr:Uncharacterised protein [Mycobacteroides abscessus subsp. abscessus]
MWVTRRCGYSAPMTRTKPRNPACSRLVISPSTTVCALRVTTNSRGGSPGRSTNSRVIRTRWRT